MRCIRCHAEDTDDAKFCRACGFPAALNEFVACSVCGGEVHVDVKTCPGCHHPFALPVPLPPAPRVVQRNRHLPAVAAIALGFLVFNLPKTDFTRIVSLKQTPHTEIKTMSDSQPPVFDARGETAGAVKVSSPAIPTEVSRPRKVHVIYLDAVDSPEAKKREAQPVKVKQKSAKRKNLVVAAAKPAEVPLTVEPLDAQPAQVALAVEEKFTPKSSNYFGREIERWHFCQGKWDMIPDCPHYPDHKPNW